tara:strand:+ start:1704 stop:2363 length:660 start_codon:yes stop_codon:yes gene_type:complete
LILDSAILVTFNVSVIIVEFYPANLSFSQSPGAQEFIKFTGYPIFNKIYTMKKYLVFAFLGIGLISCKEGASNQEDVAVAEAVATSELAVYGDDFKNETTLSAFELGDIYNNLKPGDTINVTFEGPVEDVCQKKGCWMQVDVGATDPVFIKFKDYGFFVPKDIKDKKVVVHGQAFVSETSVEELQHYAKDGGKSEEEIAAITMPKKTLGFTATGVKINQ